MATETQGIGSILRAIASAMRVPVIIILIVLVAGSLALIGWLITEYFLERRNSKVNVSALMARIKDPTKPLRKTIANSNLPMRHKALLAELTAHPDFTRDMREALAERLVNEERSHCTRIIRISDSVARLGPMFGLLGTLIPLGPGIIALGNGDTATLSASLLTAFDTTIVGLIAAAFAFVVSQIRRLWYSQDLSMLDAVTVSVLDCIEDAPVGLDIKPTVPPIAPSPKAVDFSFERPMTKATPPREPRQVNEELMFHDDDDDEDEAFVKPLPKKGKRRVMEDDD